LQAEVERGGMRIGVLLIVLSFAGCIQPLNEKTIDVTQVSKYWGGYQPGAIYQLEQAVFLGGRQINKYSLTPEGYYDRFDTKDELKEHNIAFPDTVNQYMQSPEKYPDFAVVPRGVILKCTKILYRDNGVYSQISIYGILLNGEFKDAEVYLNHVSMSASTTSPAATIYLAPDPKYLKKVDS
jgi:hypothetical protein